MRKAGKMAQKQSSNSDTNQTGLIRDYKGRIIGGIPPAGFNVHPENRSDGGWKKEDSISYQYNKLLRLNVEQLKQWLEDNPENKRTMAMELAYQALLKARKELPYLKEITDRTEGKAQQTIDVTQDITSMGEQITVGDQTIQAFTDWLKQQTKE